MRRILSTMLMLLAAGALVAGEPAKTAATIGTTAVSQDELEQALGTRLMRLRTEDGDVVR